MDLFELWFSQGICQDFLGGSAVKNLHAMQKPQEIWVQSLGQEYPLEEDRATHSSILAWRILWTEELGRLQSIGSQRNQTHMKQLNIHSRRVYAQ